MRVSSEEDFPLVSGKFNQAWCWWAPNSEVPQKQAYIQFSDPRVYSVKWVHGAAPNLAEIPLMVGQVFREIVFPAQFLNFGNITLLVERTSGNTFRGLMQKFVLTTHVPSSWVRILAASQGSAVQGFSQARCPPIPELLVEMQAPRMSMTSVMKRLVKVPECALSEHFCVSWSLDDRDDDYWIWSHYEPIGRLRPKEKRIIIQRPPLRQEFIDFLARGGERQWEVQ